MQIHDLNKRQLVIAAMLVFLILSGLSGCSKKPINPTIVAPTASQTIALTSTPTTQVAEPSPSPTATLINNTTDQGLTDGNSRIIFAMADGDFIHLFAFHPSYLPVTRITAGAWDDESPAISPDGTKIVFTSNRSGFWDLYLLDLNSGATTQLTNNHDFEDSPSWSPDQQWITYSVSRNGHFDIIIQSITDPGSSPIQLTSGEGNNTSPTWSPLGREIAFVTDRNGNKEIWTANLETAENRFKKIAGNAGSEFDHPAWSPTGKQLAWSKNQKLPQVEVQDLTNDSSKSVMVGTGDTPVWKPDGTAILARIIEPQSSYLVAYSWPSSRLLLPPVEFLNSISVLDWEEGSVAQNLNQYLTQFPVESPKPLWIAVQSLPTGQSGRIGLVSLNNIIAPNPYLSDFADESFNALRTTVQKKVGWDVLGKLENAALSITSAPQPGIPQNWLYTGRAIALDLAPYEGNWMAVKREDFNGSTYWRLFIKCLQQDGSCGKPLTGQFWDFSARYLGDLKAYENGGKTISAPSGYWLDFTELSNRFGWERVPSNTNWRAYFPGIVFNTYVLREGLTWEEAMQQVYPQEAIDLIRANEK